ncbi:MAG: ATP-binding protein, partial [Acidimicrobiia bacterium]
NTLKHSGSPTVEIAIELSGNHLKVGVADSGVGFDPSDMNPGSGIAGLSDRIRAVGGRMTVDSGPARGTVLVAELPISGGLEASP